MRTIATMSVNKSIVFYILVSMRSILFNLLHDGVFHLVKSQGTGPYIRISTYVANSSFVTVSNLDAIFRDMTSFTAILRNCYM